MSKVTIEQLQEKFKEANEVISNQRSFFKMKNYDINSIYYYKSHDCFYIKNNDGEEDKELYDCKTKQMATIIN